MPAKLKTTAIAVTVFASAILPAQPASAEAENNVTAMAPTNWIQNTTPNATRLGVIHVRDGNYTYGTHDATLPSGSWSDLEFGWATTAGWYTGPGYCTRQFRSAEPFAMFTRQLPDLGPGQHFIGAHTFYKVEAYRASVCLSN